jgi:hypothetical protein
MLEKGFLAFGELKTRPGTPLAVFFSLFDPRIPLDKTGFLQRYSQIRISQDKRFGNTMAYRSDLA